ncbi:MAG: hypothetical protein ABI811_04260 [Acidobacteriota bacterium]
MRGLVTLLLLAAAVQAAAVREGGAPLRSSCEADAVTVTELPAATPLTIRYSLSGQRVACYKVIATVNGRTSEGYLPAPSIVDLEAFDTARKQGGVLGTREVLAAVGAPASQSLTPASPAAAVGSGTLNALAQQAANLIETSQPARALALLEPELKKRKDPGLLALAGAAAWRADDARRALELWRQSLDIQPNKQVQELYDRVERENKGDLSNQRLYGTRVLLRYEGTAISADTAREMAAVVDQEFARISAQLGCTTSERIVTIAQSRDAYKKTTAAAEWSAGQYDGRIRVPVFDRGSLDSDTRRTLAHETTHACLSMLGRWPSWLQEGVAQYMSGEISTPPARQQIAELARQKQLPSLNKLGADWSGLDSSSARVAYSLALRAVEIFNQDFASYGLRNLLRNPDNLPQYTSEIDKRLGL